MMRVLREIKNITAHYFPLTGNDLIVTTFSNEIKRVGPNSWEHSFTGVKYPKLVYGGNLFVQQREEGTLKEGTGCIDLKTGEQKELNFLQRSVLLTSLLQESKVLTRFKDQNRKKIIQLIDLGLLNPDWEIDTDLQLVWGFDKGILGQPRGKSEVVFVDIRDGRIIWHYNLLKLGSWQDYDASEKQTQVTKILGIYEGKIFIYLNSGKILLLDCGSGEKIALLENDKNTDQGSFSGMFMNAIELDKENGKLIQLFNQRYTEVDLESNVVTQIHLDDLKEQEMSNMSRFVFDSDHIYFTDKNTQTLGALNRGNHKLAWTHKLSQEGVSESEQPRYGRDLRLKDNIFYVLDNKNTLHIFDKEGESV